MASRNPKTRRTVLLLILLGVVALVALFSLNALRGTKVGKFVGLEEKAQAKEVWYCPMHPDYKSDRPGECPICNMALVKSEPEPRTEPSAVNPPAAQGKLPSERKVLYWQDSMNPGFRSDKPGKAPDGMDLMPVYAQEEAPAEIDVMPAGTVKIDPRKQQLIGVQYGEVSRGPVRKTIRTVGRLAYDETTIARIQLKIEGWIDKVYVDFTGKLVHRGEPLISIYSPELVSTEQEFLLASRARDVLKESPIQEVSSGAMSLYESAKERLRLWDISEAQIREIESRGTPTRTLTLYAPIEGFVLTRDAFPNQRVTPETVLYSIADLDTVWVLADVYEYEAPMIRLGQDAEVTLSYYPGQAFHGRVSYIYPQLDNTARTLKIRIELANPGYKLKPDMYADVNLEIDYGIETSVPEEAVLDSGSEQIVFVAREGGYLEPRKVELGPKVDRRFIVLAGLEPGEKIVTSGNFLVDSESQLKSAIGAVSGGEVQHGHD